MDQIRYQAVTYIKIRHLTPRPRDVNEMKGDRGETKAKNGLAGRSPKAQNAGVKINPGFLAGWTKGGGGHLPFSQCKKFQLAPFSCYNIARS